MEDNYYIPEIEEFHVGFEYEMVPSIGIAILNTNESTKIVETKWATDYVKLVYGKENISFSTGLPSISAAIADKKCRVKFLDVFDIQSLRFKLSKINDAFFEFSYYNYNLTYHSGDNKVIIKFKDRIIFDGYIKNKSELKRLTRQLLVI